MHFKSINDMVFDIKTKLIPKLPKDIGTVYGVPRSGMIPASIVSTILGANLGVVGQKSFHGKRIANFTKMGDKVLIVDDSMYRGGAMSEALKLHNGPCYTCAIYVSPEIKNNVNYFAEILPGPRFFEWNFLGIKATEDFVFDMDGVICEDPKVYDDDGSAYQREIESIKPLYIPQVKIKAICTNRIERWRPQTEAWLRRNSVIYDKLLMQPFQTAVERRLKSTSAGFKAQYYINNGSLFVESHDVHAKEIAKITKKPVLSIESMKLF